MSDKQLAKQYKFIVNASRDLMTLIDHNHIYVAANDAYCYAHQKARSEIVGKTVASVWGETRYLDQIKPSLDQCFAGEEVHYQGWFDVVKLGRRFFDVAYYPYAGDEDKISLVAVVSRDVTKLKQTEEELQRRNRELALLNQIIAASATGVEPEIILETVCRELTQVLDVSKVTATLLNRDKTKARVVAEFLVEGRTTILHQSIPVAADPVFQYLLNHQAPLVVNDATKDLRLAHAHRFIANVQTSSLLMLPLIMDEGVVGSLALSTTIPHTFSPSEINLAWSVADQVAGALTRTWLNQEYRRLSIAIEQAADSIIITDAHGAVVYVNPAFEKLSGYSRDEVIDQNPRMFQSGKHDPDFYASLWQVLLTGQVWHGRLVNKKKDGTFYTADATISPVRNEDDQVVNYVALERDVTRELQLEDQLNQAQKMEAIGRLAGGVAHDFNNILTVINGHSELLLHRFLQPDDPSRWEVKQIQEAGERAAVLTHQLLAFSRRQAVQPKILNLNDAVTDLQKMLRRLIDETIQLDITLDPKLGAIKADTGQLTQVLMNLVVNARDAMPDGGRISIETGNAYLDETFIEKNMEAVAGPYVLLSVSDTGIGLDKETKSHIFEPFFTTKGEGKGTGLGLSTVYGIIRQNNGFIWVYSEPGQGTVFKIYLPQITKDEQETLVSRPVTVTSLTGTETILLVEDEVNVRLVACKFLKKHGYTVLEVGHPKEALQLCQQDNHQIDLLITDVIMPDMSGRELAEQLTRSYPNLKVLYISGYANDALSQYGVIGSGIAFLEKPFSSESLAHKVRETLDTH
jgi:PAS domain S-box-containing protein